MRLRLTLRECLRATPPAAPAAPTLARTSPIPPQGVNHEDRAQARHNRRAGSGRQRVRVTDSNGFDRDTPGAAVRLWLWDGIGQCGGGRPGGSDRGDQPELRHYRRTRHNREERLRNGIRKLELDVGRRSILATLRQG